MVCSDQDSAQHVWRGLAACYKEKHRHYHTLEHIEYCLASLDAAGDVIEDRDAVELALWFHDIVFKTGAKDNEALSAELFQRFAKGKLSELKIAQVSALILATMFHHNDETPIDSDTQFMVDIDLSSFALDLEAFEKNSDDLRKEQAELSDQEFEQSKKAFFQSLLERRQIFFTSYFHQECEMQARSNIRQALERL